MIIEIVVPEALEPDAALPVSADNPMPVVLPTALPAGANNIGVVGTVPGQKVGQGRFFLAGSGRLDLALAGNLRGVMQNPSASGRNISIGRFIAYSSVAAYAHLFINPTVGVPVTAPKPVINAVLLGGQASVATLRSDTNTTTALSGGTDTGIDLGIPFGRTVIDLPPLVLVPGVSVGFNIAFAGAANASFDVFWWEDPLV